MTPESFFDDFGVVRLIHRAAYIPKITVLKLYLDLIVCILMWKIDDGRDLFQICDPFHIF